MPLSALPRAVLNKIVDENFRVLDDRSTTGDAFAAGLIYARVQGWDWLKSARMGNACGAIVVTRHGCANFMPTLDEVAAFVAGRGEPAI